MQHTQRNLFAWIAMLIVVILAVWMNAMLLKVVVESNKQHEIPRLVVPIPDSLKTEVPVQQAVLDSILHSA